MLMFMFEYVYDMRWRYVNTFTKQLVAGEKQLMAGETENKLITAGKV